MKRLSLIFTFLWISTSCLIAANTVLENSKIKLITDGKHIISLYDKLRQIEHVSTDYTLANGLMGINYVDPASSKTIGTVNSSTIESVTTLTSNASNASFLLENEIMKATISVGLKEAEAELFWNISIELKNKAYAVGLVDFPRFRTLQSYGGKIKQFLEATAEGQLKSVQTAIAWYRFYPGKQQLQMGACFSSAAGFMIWTDDTKPNIKSFGFKNDGVSSNYAIRHLMAYDSPTWTSSYNSRISLCGPAWQDAADIYRDWATTQTWSATKLKNRTDVPALLHSPPLVISAQLTRENLATLPATLKAWSDKFGAPVIYRPTHWEKNGIWVGIDYFPVAIGNNAYQNLNTQLKANNITTAGFMEGFHWTKSLNPASDSRNPGLLAYYNAMNGNQLAKSDINGAIYTDTQETRNEVYLCRGTEFGKTLMPAVANQLFDLGVSHFHDDFDHITNMGGPCYNKAHGHPVPYGSWESDIMDQVFSQIAQEAKNRKIKNFFMTRENGSELQNMMLQGYQERNFYDVTQKGVLRPLYLYVYHEYIPVIFGLETANTKKNVGLCALITYGQIPSLAFWNAPTQAPNTNVMDVETAAVLKDYYDSMKGHAKDFLLYGRLLRPALVSDPGVIHQTWESESGNIGIFAVDTLASSTTVEVKIPGSTPKFMTIFDGSSRISSAQVMGGDTYSWTIPKWRLSSIIFSGSPLTTNQQVIPERKMNLYPNPVTDELHIQIDNDLENWELEVTDMTGKLLIREKNRRQLTMKHLDKGFYIVRINSGAESFIQKIVRI